MNKQIIEGAIGTIYGMRVIASDGVPEGKYIPIPDQDIIISHEDAKKIKGMSPEEAGKLLGSLITMNSPKTAH